MGLALPFDTGYSEKAASMRGYLSPDVREVRTSPRLSMKSSPGRRGANGKL